MREHRHRERSVATLMRSLYATGRQVDTLQAFAQLRRRLLDDLGVDPSPPLQELEMAILHQRAGRRLASSPGTAAPPAAAAPVRHPSGIAWNSRSASAPPRAAPASRCDARQGRPVLVKAANWMTRCRRRLGEPVWRHWLEALSDGAAWCGTTSVGAGCPIGTSTGSPFDAWVDDLEMVVDTMGLDRFPLLGISQGGAVAIAYAVRHPERVSALVLCGA